MVILRKYSQILWIVSLMTLPGCFIPSRYFMRKNIFITQPTIKKGHLHIVNSDQEPIITIWVHGTRLFFHSPYQQDLQSQSPLVKAYNSNCDYRMTKIAHTLINADPERFHPEHFYIFNWSGKLCFDVREEAAQQLHQELESLIHSYRTKKLTPRIRIIGHSHGGNVALNLAHHKNSFTIDELILLACPVQVKTKSLIKDPLFKAIYALYSALDIIQILDPQGMYKHKNRSNSLFSNRQFVHQSNLAQMKVKVNGRAITHSEFAQSSFLQLLPEILKQIDLWHQHISYRENPNKMAKLLCVYTENAKINRINSKSKRKSV